MKKRKDFFMIKSKWISAATVLACAIFCLLAVSCQCSKDDSVSQDGLKNQTIEKAFEDYKKVMCEEDIDALRRLCLRPPNVSSEEYEYALETLLPALVREESYAEWLKDAYIVRKEYFEDGKRVKLWLGPETKREYIYGIDSPARQLGEEQPEQTLLKEYYHERPVKFKLLGERWVLDLP